MSYTLQQVLDHARVPLNDDDKVRYPDEVLLAYCIDSLNIIYRRRPDLFLGRWTFSTTSLSNSSKLPVSDTLMSVISDYVTARAEAVNDESVDTGRMQAFLQMFGSGVIG